MPSIFAHSWMIPYLREPKLIYIVRIAFAKMFMRSACIYYIYMISPCLSACNILWTIYKNATKAESLFAQPIRVTWISYITWAWGVVICVVAASYVALTVSKPHICHWACSLRLQNRKINNEWNYIYSWRQMLVQKCWCLVNWILRECHRVVVVDCERWSLLFADDRLP